MKARIIAIANNKGGVGKTTTSATLSVLLSEKGYRVLLVDLDAQANATAALLNDQPQASIFDAIVNNDPLPVINIRDSEAGGSLRLVPSSLTMSWFDLRMSNELAREHKLKELLDPLAGEYDFIILDCPPSLGLITQNAFVAATDVIVPFQAEKFSIDGLAMVVNFYNMIHNKATLNPSLNLLGMLMTQYASNTLVRKIEDWLNGTQYKSYIFQNRIRKTVAVGKAQAQGESLMAFDPKSTAAQDYAALCDEILIRLNQSQTTHSNSI